MTGDPVTVPAHVGALAERVRAARAASPDRRRRTVVGIFGPPGAGKSTLAGALVEALRSEGEAVALAGMDGFHLAQQVLEGTLLAEIKGAPETFDANGYVALLRRIREIPRAAVYAPEFDRAIEQPIAGAVPITPAVDIVVTEGNYLLLDTPPWNAIAPLLDEAWYLDVPDEVRIGRLVARHVRFGRSPEAARQRARTGSDGANALLVAASRSRADVIVTATVTAP